MNFYSLVTDPSVSSQDPDYDSFLYSRFMGAIITLFILRQSLQARMLEIGTKEEILLRKNLPTCQRKVRMKRAFYLNVLVASILALSCPVVAATNLYVKDLSQVNLRSGPGTNFRVVSSLTSGHLVEVIEERGEWRHVRFAKENGESTEGWILSRFLVDEPPWAAQSKTFNASLKDKLASSMEEKEKLSEKGTELAAQLQAATDKLNALQTEYEAFKSGAADYLKLKEEFDSTKSALAQAQENVRVLSRDIDHLKLAQRIKWFIAGALVLILGWIIGVMMGRYQRKPRSHFRV